MHLFYEENDQKTVRQADKNWNILISVWAFSQAKKNRWFQISAALIRLVALLEFYI
jgi:prolyl oligopeptidase PreP (S9A serine peptidase family)